ncbi:MAG: HDOD domain-containing protein [Desulforegulaceae bacterium]|nr:HDOD domain-containing protein [Desulforegulaceae bacterium]
MNYHEKNNDKSIKIISASKSQEQNNEIAKILENINITPILTKSGKETIELAANNYFPLICIDSEIDDINLNEIPSIINSSKKNLKTIFLIFIHKDNSGLIPQFKKNGYEDFLIKPIDKNSFSARIETLLKLSRLENTLARAVKFIQAKEKSSTDLKNISHDIIIQWGRLETLGRLTSGIMHEITTPVQYLTDNLNFLDNSFPLVLKSLNKFFEFIETAKKGGINKDLLEDIEKNLIDSDIDYLKTEIPEAVKQSLGGIEKITTILLSIRNMARQIVNEKVSSDINKIVENAVILTKNIWKNCADLQTDLKKDLPPLQCEPGAISQVIVNLIVNAVHAVEENTEKKDHIIKVETQLENNNILIKVSDTGKGIPQNIIKKIFDPFFTTKKIEKGTGQGLAISKTIAEKHKGSLSVLSNPESMTVFTLSLPINSEINLRPEKQEPQNLIKSVKPDKTPVILFVDEDKDMLKSLNRMLKQKEKQWTLLFADSAKKALLIMEKKPADIIISEYNMNEINGYELLKTIKEKFPQTDRIILSGETDEDKIIKAVPIAHQFIYKPVNSTKLDKLLTRTIAMKNILKDKNLRITISRLDSLPSLPSIYNSIVKELNSSVSSTKKIGEIISKDPSMTSKILQLINSGFFYLPSKISKPEDAVVILGTDVVKSLVLNLEIFSKMKLPNYFKKFQNDLHEHSMAAAKTAKEIALMEGLSDFCADQAFMAGLIHDCGKLILASNFPDDYKLVLENFGSLSQESIEKEKEIFKASHEIVGAFLMGVWGLPLEIIEAILYHHNPSASSDNEFTVTSAVYAANIIELEKAGFLHSDFENAFDEKYFDRIKIYDRPKIWREKFLS